jgi:hypothetical protein
MSKKRESEIKKRRHSSIVCSCVIVFCVGTFIRRYNSVDMNVAVATDRGLITPLIKDADRLGLISISQVWNER